MCPFGPNLGTTFAQNQTNWGIINVRPKVVRKVKITRAKDLKNDRNETKRNERSMSGFQFFKKKKKKFVICVHDDESIEMYENIAVYGPKVA